MTNPHADGLRELANIRIDLRATELKAAKLRRQRSTATRTLQHEGMTIQQIAEHCAVSRQAVYQWMLK